MKTIRSLNDPMLWVVNIPFLKPKDAKKVADQLTKEGFALVRVEQITGSTYEWRHNEMKGDK